LQRWLGRQLRAGAFGERSAELVARRDVELAAQTGAAAAHASGASTRADRGATVERMTSAFVVEKPPIDSIRDG
jgi:hypothetical protein